MWLSEQYIVCLSICKTTDTLLLCLRKHLWQRHGGCFFTLWSPLHIFIIGIVVASQQFYERSFFSNPKYVCPIYVTWKTTWNHFGHVSQAIRRGDFYYKILIKRAGNSHSEYIVFITVYNRNMTKKINDARYFKSTIQTILNHLGAYTWHTLYIYTKKSNTQLPGKLVTRYSSKSNLLFKDIKLKYSLQPEHCASNIKQTTCTLYKSNSAIFIVSLEMKISGVLLRH